MPDTVPASQIVVAVIPIVGIVMGSVVIFFYALWNHREKMFMIERGQYRPPVFDLEVFSLLVGVVLGILGLVMSLVFLAVSGFSYALLGGLIPLGLGLAFLLFYALIKKRSR